MTIEEMRERHDALRTEILELAAIDELSDDQNARWDAANTEFDTVKADVDKYEAREKRVEEVRTAALNPRALEQGAEDRSFQIQRKVENPYDLSEVRTMPGSPAWKDDFRSRALKAAEDAPSWVSDEAREALTKHVEGRSDNAAAIARHALVFGSPEYQGAFDKVVKNPMFGAAMLEDNERQALRAAMAEGTTGGFMVPVFIDPTIILTNNGTTNPMRGIADVKTVATQTWKGVTSAGVTAEWTAEAAQAADASPTVAQPTITPIRADAYLQASFEMLDDTNIAEQVAMLIADAKDRLESAGFVTGTGSTQPTGIVTAISGVTASRVAGSSGAAGAADFVLADVYAVVNALPPRHRPNSSWMAEQTNLNKIRRFGEGVVANAAFWADLGVAIPPLLLGRPVYESSEMDSTIVSGSNDDVLLLGDFKKYAIVDRIGMSVIYNPLVIGANARPTGEVGWFAHWRVGGGVLDAGAFRMLRL